MLSPKGTNHCENCHMVIKLYAILVVLTMSILGCGGGGGGDAGGSSSSNDISYSGQTEPADITTSNAQEIAAEAYKGGQTGETMNPFTSLQVASQQTSTAKAELGRPIAMDLFEMLEGSLGRADIPEHAGHSIAAVQTESDTMPDDCGGSGSADYTITYDDATGVFTGSFTFNQFCSDDITYSGSAAFSGVINIGGSEGEIFSSFAFTFQNLTSTTQGASFTLDGELQYAYNAGNPRVTVDMYVKDNTSMEVVWIDDYTLAYSGQDVNISGTFYHQEHGRVTISTEQSFHFDTGEEYPSSGVMVFTGAPGTAGGNTGARIEALSSTTCRVTADTDGDGLYDDVDTGEILWSALDN